MKKKQKGEYFSIYDLMKSCSKPVELKSKCRRFLQHQATFVPSATLQRVCHDTVSLFKGWMVHPPYLLHGLGRTLIWLSLHRNAQRCSEVVFRGRFGIGPYLWTWLEPLCFSSAYILLEIFTLFQIDMDLKLQAAKIEQLPSLEKWPALLWNSKNHRGTLSGINLIGWEFDYVHASFFIK